MSAVVVGLCAVVGVIHNFWSNRQTRGLAETASRQASSPDQQARAAIQQVDATRDQLVVMEGQLEEMQQANAREERFQEPNVEISGMRLGFTAGQKIGRRVSHAYYTLRFDVTQSGAVPVVLESMELKGLKKPVPPHGKMANGRRFQAETTLPVNGVCTLAMRLDAKLIRDLPDDAQITAILATSVGIRSKSRALSELRRK